MIFSSNRCAALKAQRSRSSGFSLLELLVVIGLIATLSAAFIGGLNGGKTVALQAGQSIASNLVTAARSRALANGNPTRILLNQETAVVSTPSRYLRYLVLQEQVNAIWQTVTDIYLPDGVYLLPSNPDAALLGANWKTAHGQTLQSFAIDPLAGTLDVNSLNKEQWSVLNYSADGVPQYVGALPANESRSLVLTTGRILPPGSATPFIFDNAENVRGVTLSNYGVPILVNDRSGF